MNEKIQYINDNALQDIPVEYVLDFSMVFEWM